MLEIYAGNNALKTIQEHGLKQELFTNFLGASGGPKWFMLFGLDKYLFSEFFQNRTTELNLIGSSSGAFRAACLTQNNPVQAIEILAQQYSNTVYSKKATAQEVTNKTITLVEQLFSENGAHEVINNKVFKAHFLVAKCNGLTAFDNKILQVPGLLNSMLLNKIARSQLNKQYQRYVFKNKYSNLAINDPYNINTIYQNLTAANIKSTVLASGSIPLVMSGVKDIVGAEKGTYRDGGVIDYHFDFSLEQKNQNKMTVKQQHKKHFSDLPHSSSESKITDHNLTLYPHFSSEPKAGWFDKSSNRKVLASSYDNTVLLAPSAKFIQSLPYKKIPDRTDFTQMEPNLRIKYWQQVLKQTGQLAESFHEFREKKDWGEIRNFTP
ncbi:patatin-like phospholipase family protein [Colwellia sp. E2M01]|uniref:patatin-like phospholipase family protein n=1 Tax=Colwellia sp. E2M01 TaxID=2841561 RepID=UPI001C082793|nr:patatin-like phospholipase family protein [Colwellia sp. E2M01]MBU2870852.1 patatin-like phospholipase family protein [Colwellia sp. E2M01]